MIKIIETVNNNIKYSDTWRITFYFVGALAILIGVFWTIYTV